MVQSVFELVYIWFVVDVVWVFIEENDGVGMCVDGVGFGFDVVVQIGYDGVDIGGQCFGLMGVQVFREVCDVGVYVGFGKMCFVWQVVDFDYRGVIEIVKRF